MKKIHVALLITFFLSVFVGAHVLVFQTILHIFSISNPETIYLMRTILVILSFGFFISMIIARWVNTLVTRAMYLVLAVWVGLFFHFFMASLTYWVVNIFRDSSMYFVGVGLFGVSFVVTIGGIVQAGILRTKKYTVELKNLPDFWQGKTIAFISDLHLGQIYGVRLARKVVRRLNALAPDMVLIGGDLYDGVAVDEKKVIAPFQDLSIKHGAYFVTGNHEEYGDEKAFEKAIREVGIRILDNEMVDIQGLQIIGVNYHDTHVAEQYQQVMSSIVFDPDKPSILVKHVPSHLNIAQEAGVDIQISGHTHRGQVFPLSLIGRLAHHGFDYGWQMYKDMQTLVSSGVGNWGPPVRVGTSSEIVLITLKNKE